MSVVIRTYNRANYLGEAVDSVLAQTFSDLELIVVDDGSTDETSALLDHYAYASRVTRVTLGHTGNPATVMNAGIRRVRGDFIAFLDSDDVWLPDKLQHQMDLLSRGAHFGFAYGNVRALHPDGRVSDPVWAPDQMASGSVLRAMVRNMCVHLSTVVVRRRWLDAVGDFDERLPPCEDFLFLLRLARATGAACLPQPVCLIRQHDKQSSRTAGLAAYERAIFALESLRQERGLSWSVCREARRSIARYHTHLAQHLAEAGRDADARRHAVWSLRSYPLQRAAWLWMGRRLAGRKR